jgi:hypothetical protein
VAQVEVVERLVEEHRLGVLAEHHRHERPLPLTAGELAEEAVGEVTQAQVVERPLHVRQVLGGGPSLGVRVETEG